MSNLSNTEVFAKICMLYLWEQYPGYGFSIYTHKRTNLHRVMAIEHCSPADTGGLTDGDIIIEINGQNVSEFTHKEVVDAAKQYPHHVSLLVMQRPHFECLKTSGMLPKISVIKLESTKTMIDPNDLRMEAVINELHPNWFEKSILRADWKTISELNARRKKALNKFKRFSAMYY